MDKGLQLRALEPEDLELVFAIENNRDLWRWGANNVPVSRYTVRQYLSSQQNDIYLDGQLRQVMTIEGQPVGIVDLCNFEPRHQRAEGGIVVLPEFHRCGIATEALRQLCVYASSCLHLRSLYAYVAADNEPALRLFLSAGYTETARLKRWLEGDSTAVLFQLML